jgi:hypothetical protein
MKNDGILSRWQPSRRSARIVTALYWAGWLAVIAACVWFFYVIALCQGWVTWTP